MNKNKNIEILFKKITLSKLSIIFYKINFFLVGQFYLRRSLFFLSLVFSFFIPQATLISATSDKKNVDIEVLVKEFDENMVFILDVLDDFSTEGETSISKFLQAYNTQNLNEMLFQSDFLLEISLVLYIEEMVEIMTHLGEYLRDGQNNKLQEAISEMLCAFNKTKRIINQIKIEHKKSNS